MKLDLGCGEHKTDGLIGLDIVSHPCVDIQHDLAVFPYPFHENSVDYIQANHVLEHVDSFIQTVEELWRICKDGAVIEVRGPHASCFPTVWADPTHKRAFVKHSFIHWQIENNHIYGLKGAFMLEEVRLHYCLYQGVRNGKATTSDRMRRVGNFVDMIVNSSDKIQGIFERFLCGYLGGFEEVYFKLRVVKV